MSSRHSVPAPRRDCHPLLVDAAKASLSPARSRAAVRTGSNIERGAEDLLALLVADVQDYAILALDVDGNVVS